jgi:hypothetical protein
LMPKRPRVKVQVRDGEKRNSVVNQFGLERGRQVVDSGIGKPNRLHHRTSHMELPPIFLEQMV